MRYPNLFSEGRIGSLRLKNRVVMPAMGTMLASADGEVSDHMIAYFEERARGGVGLIITEVTSIEYTLGKAGAVHPRVDDNKFIPMLSRLAHAVHKHDSRIFMQLHHVGRQGNSMLTGGLPIVAPSPIPYCVAAEVPRALETVEVKDLVQRFIMGALRCKMAGIDGVELHAAHGYLMNQFLSPQSNKRTDEYGGSFKNRMRFVKEVVEGIKNTCGMGYPVIVRLSIDEFVEGGVHIDEGLKISQYMESIGVDAIDASVGTYESIETVMEPVTFEQGWRTYIAEAVKKKVNIPVITVGVIREPEFAESVLREKKADFVGIGRGLIADPEWCLKSYQGREAEIRKCISCLHCVDNGLTGIHITCAINARAGREIEFQRLEKDGGQRKTVVIGGGPGGMEAARVLASRNFDVVLFEKEDRLGGQINFGNKPRGKDKMTWLVDYLGNELKRLKVNCRFQDQASYEKIKNEDPYAIFIATGGNPIIPKIDGVDQDHVLLAEAALRDYQSFENQKVAVIGAGITGCETAELLASIGNEVLLFEQLPDIATGSGLIGKKDMLAHLEKSKVQIFPNHKLVSIGEKSILVEDLKEHTTIRFHVDKVVISLGIKSDKAVYDSIKDQFDKVFIFGDANSPGKIANAIREGYEKAALLN